MSATRLPRGAVLVLAALILSFPAMLAAGQDYRKTPEGLIKHRHTDSYGVLNMVGTEDSQLRDAVNAARNQWDQKLQARDTVRLQGDLASPEIVTHRQGLGDNGAYVAWEAPYHPSDYTRMTFNSDKIATVSNSLMQGIACKAFGGIMGLEASGPQGGCMADSANVTPSNTSADNLDRFYGPNVDLAGSMYVERNELRPSRIGSYALNASASGHAMRSITVKIDGVTIASQSRTPCAEKCSVSATVTPTEAQIPPPVPGEHTVSVTATNEFGRSVTRSFEITVLPYWGFAELWVNINHPEMVDQIPRTGNEAGGVGAPTNRLNVGWSAAQNAEGAPFNWSRVEPEYDAMIAAGQRPILLLESAPVWATCPLGQSCTTPPACAHDECQYPPHPTRYAQWEAFVSAAVAKFPNVVAIEVWNEPNFNRFWSPTPDPNAYADLLRHARAAIDRTLPDPPPVLVGGLAPGETSVKTFLTELYELEAGDPDPRLDFEGIGVHAYPIGFDVADRVTRLVQTSNVVEKARDDAGDPGTSIWLTEVGIATGTDFGEIAEGEQGPTLEAIYRAAGPDEDDRIDAEVLLIYKWVDEVVSNDPRRFRNMGVTHGTPENPGDPPRYTAKPALQYLGCELEGLGCQ